MARAAPAAVRGHGHRRHARPLLPRQRRRLDPRTRPRRGHPVEGQLLVLARAEAGAPAASRRSRRSQRQKTLERELEWIRMSPEGAPGQEQGAHQRVRERCSAQQNEQKRAASSRSTSRPARAWAAVVIEADDVAKGYGDTLLVEDMTFTLPPGGIVGVIGPNGAGKTTLFRMITGEEKPDAGTIRVGETVQARLRRPDRARSTRRRPSGRRSPAARTSSSSARARCNSRAYVGALQLHRLRPAEEGRRRSPAASATASTSPRC